MKAHVIMPPGFIAGWPAQTKLTETEHAEKERILKTFLLQLGFLTTLTEAAKTYGHSGDFVEVNAFLGYCFQLAGLPLPNIEPYNID